MFDCVLGAWERYEPELRRFLLANAATSADAEDLLQEIFTRSMLQGARFCKLENPRAWLFQVARNALIDAHRTTRKFVDIEQQREHLLTPPVDGDGREPIAELEGCVRRNLPKLSAEDREIIERCDLDGMKQADFAEQYGLSLSAAKSRLQRARKKLRALIIQNCQVRFDDNGCVCCYSPPQGDDASSASV